MTHLRQIMLEELRRRNFADSTIRSYLHAVEHFSRYFHRRPDQLGPEHIRQYQAALFTKLKFSPNTVTLRLAALRFFYIQVLKLGWSVAETPYPKKILRLPQVLSQEEVARLIDAAEFPFHRILLMTLYATGARRAEVAHLKISDIDSQRMVVHIRGSKGRKDRDVMLSPKLLDALASIGAGSGASLLTGCFRATVGTRQVIPSPPKFFGQPASAPHNALGLSTSTSIPILCATALPPICSKLAPTCAPSRYCWGIATLRRRRSICISPGGTSAPPAVRWMHSRSEEKENRRRTHEPATSGGGRHRSLCRAVLH